MHEKYRQKNENHRRNNRESKPTFLDRIFNLLEGPVATTLVKLFATGLICGTTVILAAIMAIASFSFSVVLSTVALGMVTTGIIWIFGGWKRTPQSNIHKLEALTARIEELEERLQHVEIIERFEDRLAGQVNRHQTENLNETTFQTSEAEIES